ncbi:MAG: hypothetical protein EOP38_05460 [Rubrivivax sp.]|nr:MAG: hypothetical protein EOP38_05460 [Rubrivivax sp.]
MRWLKKRLGPRRQCSPDQQRAHDLIEAIDAGGVPLNPARVNAIARSLGLEVSTKAPVEETIERIRQQLARMP